LRSINSTVGYIEEFCLYYFLKHSEATAKTVRYALWFNGVDMKTLSIARILNNSPFFDKYKNKQRVNVYFLKEEVKKALENDEELSIVEVDKNERKRGKPR
jgi:hypothetical protein